MKIILFILLHLSFIYAQGLKADEQQFLKLEEHYLAQVNVLDSLNNALNTFVKKLDRVKKNDADDNDKISSMMAQALEKSNVIDSHRQKLLVLEKQLKQKRQQLYKKYTFKIDSLEKLNRNAVESDIKLLKSKRLYVSPLLRQFSFDPKLIEKIKVSNSHDEKEKSIYKEYLSNALNEVDTNIVNLQMQSDNIREVIRLNEQAEDFIEDIEGDQFSGSFAVTEQTLVSEDMNFIDNRGTPFLEFDKVATIYNRISPYIYENFNLYDYSLQDSIYTDDYLKLLEETVQTLRLYREKIRDKLQ